MSQVFRRNNRGREGALFLALEVTEEVTVCDCCGLSDLRSTVLVEHCASGEHFYFGRDCAAQATHPWARLSSKFAAFVPHGAP